MHRERFNRDQQSWPVRPIKCSRGQMRFERFHGRLPGSCRNNIHLLNVIDVEQSMLNARRGAARREPSISTHVVQCRVALASGTQFSSREPFFQSVCRRGAANQLRRAFDRQWKFGLVQLAHRLVGRMLSPISRVAFRRFSLFAIFSLATGLKDSLIVSASLLGELLLAGVHRASGPVPASRAYRPPRRPAGRPASQSVSE